MYRPCMHCKGKKYDPDYCPLICDYGYELKWRKDHGKAMLAIEKCFMVEFERHYSDTVKEECVALFRPDQVSEEDVVRYIRGESKDTQKLHDKIIIMRKIQYDALFGGEE